MIKTDEKNTFKIGYKLSDVMWFNYNIYIICCIYRIIII